MADLPRPSTEENISTTLSSGITDIATTITVGDASKLVAPTYLVIDRVDSSGTLKNTSFWEYVKVTNIAGSDLTVTRGVNGSTNQSHSSGAVVEAVVTSAHFEDWYNALNPEHTDTGGHVITSTMTVAGMNLASVATIASAGIGTGRVVTHLNASGASLSGFGPYPVWVIPGVASGATTSAGKPLVMPRGGTWNYFNVVTRSPVSTASLTLDINKNFASIFDSVGRPVILGGGTFVSTASIATKVFKAGDVFTVDIDTGGNVSDLIVQGVA